MFGISMKEDVKHKIYRFRRFFEFYRIRDLNSPYAPDYCSIRIFRLGISWHGNKESYKIVKDWGCIWMQFQNGNCWLTILKKPSYT